MECEDSVFLSYIRMVLKKWTGLQLAVLEGMAGPFAKEKEVWFGNEIEQFFKKNEGLLPYEVEDFMSAILDAEFNTIAEDGSVIEIAKEFCRIFQMCKNGSEAEVLKLIPETVVVSPAAAVSTFVPEVQEKQETGGQAECNIEVLPSQMEKLPSQIEKLNVNDVSNAELSDGWTEVRRGRKKKSS